MPHYVFFCRSCNKDFEVVLHIEELEKDGIRCPHCGSDQVSQKPAAFAAVTGKKS
jgi:putative FmdB family regulatory protein